MNKMLQQGFSLIELMISILLGTILLLGVMQVMISSSTLGTTSTNLSENQDRAKTVLDLLGGEAQRAGYRGCGAGGIIEWEGYTEAEWKKAYPIVPVFDGGKFGLRFTYGSDSGVSNSSGVKVKDTKDCQGKDLHYRSYVYKNCIDDDSERKGVCLLVTENPKWDNQLSLDVFDDVTLDKVVFTVAKNKEIGKETFREFSVGNAGADYTSEFLNKSDTGFQDIQAANLITFYITVTTTEARGYGEESRTDASTAVKRQYSASYQLKNLGN